ncbi:MAG: ribosome recycling factor [Candidatus Shapirobacteria bacterium]|nr:ribosome recycling factor [Candidatus Shapirobacteria bacterium]
MQFNEVREKMSKALEALLNDLNTLRTGQANPALIERIMVEAYETRMSLLELATITTDGPAQLLVTPFDQTILKNIEKSLTMDRNLGFSVSIDGSVIRIQIPPLSEERRQEFIKILHQKLEAGRVMIRQARHEAMENIQHAFNDKDLGEDEKFRFEEQLQKITDEFNSKIDEMGSRKETELLAI